jgi:site-specific recombinase XerD
MHVFFDPEGRPFLLDSQMRWGIEPNAFLARMSMVRGRTSSARTWRSYAYQLADWLSFCERIGVEWRHAAELNLATYRNILSTESSPQTGRPLKRSTINHKLTVICQFYRFAHRKGWIDALPFDLEAARLPPRTSRDLPPYAQAGPGARPGNSVRLPESRVDLRIPPRQEVRRFIASFRSWRDQLMAQVMWLTGMRCSEVCALPVNALPDAPSAIDKETVAIRILGKGQKRRAVLFPVRVLRSIDRYLQMDRWRRASGSVTSRGRVFVGRTGMPLQPSAVNRVFATNGKRAGVHIWPHLLRHCYAVERLAYLQDIGAPNPLKVVQMELGHAHLATTERYLHVTERMRAEVLEAHNSFVDRLLGA